MGNKAVWDGQTPMVAKSNFGRDVWYSNDNDFKRSIPGFSHNDRYSMRWTGNVNNAGNHGMRSREGCVNTKKGWHKLVLTSYENGGGAGMQVSIKGPQTNNQWTKLTVSMTTPRRP